MTASLFFSALLLTATAGSHVDRSCGGDGPRPLSDISAHGNLSPVKTDKAIQEFVLWPRKGEVVYRTVDNELYVGTQRLSDGPRPLSMLVDPAERYLLALAEPWLLDSDTSKGWAPYRTQSVSLTHVFWARNQVLYDAATPKDAAGNEYLVITAYRPGQPSALPVCPRFRWRPGQGLRLGHGHEYPGVFLYRVVKMPRGNRLSMFSLDVTTCRFKDMGTYTHFIQGEVQSVHRFEPLKSVAVKIDHPTMNLLWDPPAGCRYYDIGNRVPIFPSYSKPWLATWDKSRGFDLIDLNGQNRAQMLKDAPFEDLRADDVKLAADGKTLVIAPKRRDDNQRWLYRMKLD